MSHSDPQASEPHVPVPIADAVDQLLVRVGQFISWIFAILMVVILLQVLLRRGFSAGLIALEELQWHLYAIGVMIGVVYAQARNSHVRVDVLHAHFPPFWKYLIEIIGMVVLLLPFLLLVFYHGVEFVHEAYRINERSLAPAGLPYRWLIKSMIPLCFGLLILACCNRIYRDIVLLTRRQQEG
ncbi:MAG: C4-dicarboxylate ABC transporter [Oceanospirillaceae bacterium]|nr:C4-dicarboxylate ABC transporter [Oceanospirillaceae bacterium]|tara:strand:- start:2409 stop:2957 length:549 start_codon:yes stop_codon:yes gene_type:complete